MTGTINLAASTSALSKALAVQQTEISALVASLPSTVQAVPGGDSVSLSPQAMAMLDQDEQRARPP